MDKKGKWTPDLIIYELKRLSNNGIAPSIRALNIYYGSLYGAVYYNFGTWIKACEAAGVIPQQNVRYQNRKAGNGKSKKRTSYKNLVENGRKGTNNIPELNDLEKQLKNKFITAICLHKKMISEGKCTAKQASVNCVDAVRNMVI